tara:strand:- start:1210 stop:1971 length:762 start_codon:yes stop_codon:yes gene_type:complete
VKRSLKISIITVSFNSEKTIKDTIESVLSQTYNNIEYLIIDANSSDATIKIINSFGNKIDYFISESDNGIYDGMNKGIKQASGDVIGILNSDDIYENNYIIEEVVTSFLNNEKDILYGDLVYIDSKSNNLIRYWKSGFYNRKLLRMGWMLPHPTLFVRRDIYMKYGYYSDKLKSAADYEMMIRLLYKHECSAYYLAKVMVKMKTGGYSNKSIFNRIRGNKEDVMAWKLNGYSPSFLLRLYKPLTKVKQFLNRP